MAISQAKIARFSLFKIILKLILSLSRTLTQISVDFHACELSDSFTKFLCPKLFLFYSIFSVMADIKIAGKFPIFSM